MSQSPNFEIGSGIYDITGPAAGRRMLGYLKNKTAGIHLRLRSRAFVIKSKNTGQHIAMACADLDILPHAVKSEVLKKLKVTFPDGQEGTYKDENVLLCANHTHSGPAGYSHYALYNFGVGRILPAFDERNFEAIVDGIYLSIVKAHNNLAEGDIYIKTEELKDAGWNRSPQAYQVNPEQDRQGDYCYNTNKKMTLLKFLRSDGEEIGLWNWFASHNTSLGNKNKLISGDHKGYAAYKFEKDKGTVYTDPKTFVAAFAQAEEGDVSPNIPWGPPDGEHDFEHLEFIGDKEYKKAIKLYDPPDTEMLVDDIQILHRFVDFSGHPIDQNFQAIPYVDPDFKPGCASPPRTCQPAVGLHLLAGSTEDGPGLFFVKEGLEFVFPKILRWAAGWVLRTFFTDADVVACHRPKDVVLSKRKVTIPLRGDMYILPKVLPIQIIRIGKLVILAVPAEVTTMSGRRLMNTVRGALPNSDQYEMVVAGISNAFSGYLATEHEYMVQHYEGASTLFGAYTLNAYLENFYKLASNTSAGTQAIPDSLADKQPFKTRRRKTFDRAPLFRRLGSVRKDAEDSYQPGQKVEVQFWGAHPSNKFRNQDSFMEVQIKEGSSWTGVAHDWDHETRFRWKKACFCKSKITIEWYIPEGTAAGEYKILYRGDKRAFPWGTMVPIEGESRVFQVS